MKVEITEVYTYTIDIDVENEDELSEAIHETKSVMNMNEDEIQDLIDNGEFYTSFDYKTLDN